jgi:tetratricopeptide (TPR) repeat protein
MEREPYRPGLGQNQNLVRQLKELQKNPRSLVFVQLADSYRAESLPHQALEILDEGLVHHPGLASALISKARCLFDLRRFGEASLVCREILKANPANIKARKLEADIFVRLGQRKAAMRALAMVLTHFPQDREAAKALEELENLETPVIVPPERVGRASSDVPPSSLGLIQDFHVGSFREALASVPVEPVAGSGSVTEPVSASIAVSAATPVAVSRALADFDAESDSETETATETDSDTVTFATRTIAELYLRQGLKGKAMKVLRKILQEDPTHEWARETLQDLGSDGIVPLAQKSPAESRRAALAAKARLLEQMLAQVRLHRAPS